MSTKRKPGRPPAGANGSHVRSYSKRRIDPETLELLRVAAAPGEPLHVTLARVVRDGLKT